MPTASPPEPQLNLQAAEEPLTGKVPFEMHNMELTHDGFDVTFTKPLDAADDGSSLVVGDSSSYFRWLLGAVLALLLVEPCLAWRFGRSRE